MNTWLGKVEVVIGMTADDSYESFTQRSVERNSRKTWAVYELAKALVPDSSGEPLRDVKARYKMLQCATHWMASSKNLLHLMGDVIGEKLHSEATKVCSPWPSKEGLF